MKVVASVGNTDKAAFIRKLGVAVEFTVVDYHNMNINFSQYTIASFKTVQHNTHWHINGWIKDIFVKHRINCRTNHGVVSDGRAK